MLSDPMMTIVLPGSYRTTLPSTVVVFVVLVIDPSALTSVCWVVVCSVVCCGDAAGSC